LKTRQADLESREHEVARAAEWQHEEAARLEQQEIDLTAMSRELAGLQEALTGEREDLTAQRADLESDRRRGEDTLSEHSDTVARREAEIHAQLQELGRVAAELDTREFDLRRAERRVADDLAEVDARRATVEESDRRREGVRTELLRKSAVLAERERRLAEVAAKLDSAKRQLDPDAAPADLAQLNRSRWEYATLEALVETVGDTEGERAAELRSYLDQLREYADEDGFLPDAFEPLVDEIFGPVVDAAASA
jgi:chromosome segregation ATPase